MKKLLYLLPLLLLVILSSCDTTDLQFDNHDYVLKYDNEQHYQECECGDIIDTQAHTFSEPIIRLEPTCTNTGIKEYKCTGCEFIKLEDIAALGHIEIIDKAIEVGCENEGLTEGSHCERCNQVLNKQEAIECLGHDYSEFKTVTEATCEGEGLEKKVCNNCSNEVFNTLPAKGHEYTEFITSKEPTCEGEGLEKKTCPNCSSEIFNTLEPKGHTYSDFTITKNPTCTETGLKSRSCECGHIDYAEIEPKGHTPKDGEALNSTCTEYGHTAPVLCKDCGITLTKEELLPLLEHNYDDGVITQEASITYQEIVEYTCKDCGNIKREYNSSLPVTTELLTQFDMDVFNNDIKIDVYIGTNDYDLKYIKSGDREYLYVIDRELDTYTEYYKYVYNDIELLCTRNMLDNTFSHEWYDDSIAPFKAFKEYVIGRNQFAVDNFESLEMNRGPKHYIGNIIYNDKEVELTYNVTEYGLMTSTHIYAEYTINVYYETHDITLPRMYNVHDLPENGKCPTCSMECYIVKNYNDNYKEEYYVYEDQTYAYSSLELVENTLPEYCQTKILKGTNTYYKITYYIVRNYIATNLELYSFRVESYDYNYETGHLELKYIDGDKTIRLNCYLKNDGSMEINNGGSIAYYTYPETYLNQVFEYRFNQKAYRFRFTENVMYIEVYETNDIVYLPEIDASYTKIQDGTISTIFKRKGRISFYLKDISTSFSSGSLVTNYTEFSLTCSDLNINIVGTIYDIECYNKDHLYYWVETEEGIKYKIYVYDDYVYQIEEL